MSSAKLGSVVGAGFGSLFVLVNTGSLPAAVAVLLRVLAVLAFIAVLGAGALAIGWFGVVPVAVRLLAGGSVLPCGIGLLC